MAVFRRSASRADARQDRRNRSCQNPLIVHHVSRRRGAPSWERHAKHARLSYTVNERWTIEAFVTNAFDEDYILDAGNTGDAAGMPTFIGGAPRMYGVQASVRF